MREDMRKIERNMELVHERVLMKAKSKQQDAVTPSSSKMREFKPPEDDNDISEYSKKRFAPQSKRKIMWAVNMYNHWRQNRMTKPGVPYQIIQANLEMMNGFTQSDLCYSMCRFVREVKKLDGSDYPPNTIRELVVMIQMFMHENGIFWKLLDNAAFLSLRNVVDNTMKQRHSEGLGVRRSSDIISLDNENSLFGQGVLGDENPLQLLRTMIYIIGMHCALRGGIEHNKLRRPGCNSQFSVEKDDRGLERLVYKEDPLQKNNQGGLVCKGRSKVVYVYGATDKKRCPVTLFKKYVRLLPQTTSCAKFYLRCKKKQLPNLWYCDQPYGVNRIKSAVKEMCKEGGLIGHYTNHSLRATCASRMFDQNVPEQIIKEVTGHRSDCVRVYKRTGDHLRQVASNVVAGESLLDKDQNAENNVTSNEEEGKGEDCKETKALSYAQMMKNVIRTRGELRVKKFNRCKLRAKSALSKAKRFTIDLNLNMNVVKKG